MSAPDPIVIAGAARTPMGGFLGDFKDAAAQRSARARLRPRSSGPVPADSVDEILMGCVLPAGQGQAPARQAAMAPACRWRRARPRSTRCAAPA